MALTTNGKTTAALSALCLLAAPATAGEWELGLGAEYEQFFGYVSYDSATASDFEGADAVASGRVFVAPALTLDNGLSFGGNFELDAHLGERNAGVVADEAALYLKGGFGTLQFGKTDTPGNHMHMGAPVSFGPEVNNANISAAVLPSLLQFSNVHSTSQVGDDLIRGTLGSTYASNMRDETGLRLSYYSPRISGLQLGLSYAPDGPSTALGREDFIDVGANYTRSFGAVDAAVSAKWGLADSTAGSPEYWGLGLSLGFGALSVGGSYSETSGSAGGLTDGQAYDIGVKYETGRYGLSVHYLSGENIDDENAALGGKEQLQALTLAASYSLTGPASRDITPPGPAAPAAERYGRQPGMDASIFGFVSMTEFSEDLGDGGLGTPGDDNDGWVIGTGFRLTF
ncbi:porin [Roseovarius faecimaris]|uniref:Porin n=1 Tax=Roseovarius faecimaris TaxID=2494550 RepID=A0A6I6IS90_9RHOB|nr:porin [Roseovarius faecimaris]QGX98994.1 porin [Roseovarius faecimaris]